MTDPDSVPRALMTLTANANVEHGERPPEALKLSRRIHGYHRHRKGQFVVWWRGVLSCEVEGELWVVPPRSGLWIPGGLLHRMKAVGISECYGVFLDADASLRLPSRCCSIAATPLLRELVIRSAGLPALYGMEGNHAHLIGLLVEEISASPMEHFRVRVPTDPRLRRIFDQLLADPAERGTIRTWAERGAISGRTLSRLVMQQTGMGFAQWRQRLQLMFALQWMGEGRPVKRIADDLGYASVSSFVAMFRKTLGAPPNQYLARHGAITAPRD